MGTGTGLKLQAFPGFPRMEATYIDEDEIGYGSMNCEYTVASNLTVIGRQVGTGFPKFHNFIQIAVIRRFIA